MTPGSRVRIRVVPRGFKQLEDRIGVVQSVEDGVLIVAFEGLDGTEWAWRFLPTDVEDA